MTNLRRIFDIRIKKNASWKAHKHWKTKNNLIKLLTNQNLFIHLPNKQRKKQIQ